MSTFVSALLVGLVGIFCMLDSRLLGRLNFEQPLIGATLVGLVLGDIPTGLAVGAATELVTRYGSWQYCCFCICLPYRCRC